MLALRVRGGVVAAYFRGGEVKRATGVQLCKLIGVSKLDGMTLIVPEGTTAINQQALERLGFRHVVLPASLRYLRAYSFRLNLSLIEVVVPPHCVMQDGVFSQCVALKEARIGQCETIPPHAFFRCTALETVHLVGVRRILERAFQRCSSLRSISLPDTVDTIEMYAFQESGLESFEFPPLVQRVEKGCFFYAPRLKRVDLRNVTVIGTAAFSNSQLQSVSIPNTVETILHNAFEWSTLQALEFQEGGSIHLHIGSTAFGWTRLQTVVLPRRVRLDSCTFYECSELKALQFHPDSECNATVNMCFGCFKLRSVTLPRRVTIIDHSAFCKCTMLSDINIHDTDLEKIGQSAFEDCSSIRDVKLPNEIEEIGREAFRNSGVHRVKGSGLNGLRIGIRAFSDCKWLYTVTFDYGGVVLKVEPQPVRRLANQFEGCTRLQTLLMPNYRFSEEIFRARLPTLLLYDRPNSATLRAAEKLHAEWWRQMFLLDPDHRRSAYHILWVLKQCGLPHLVAVMILRSLRPFDLEQVRHV